MQYFKCEECGKIKHIAHRELIIDLDSDNGTADDLEVCADCHGDVYKFRNTIGGGMDNIKQPCERCGKLFHHENLENVDGELVCKEKCADLHKRDLAQYRALPEDRITWECFVVMTRCFNGETKGFEFKN